MGIMNYRRLIKKYAALNPHKLIHRSKLGAKIDMDKGGKVIDQFTEREITGALLRSRTAVREDDGGYGYIYEHKLYCYYKLEEGDHLLAGDKKYRVTPLVDYSAIDTNGEGLYIYTLEGDDVDATLI